MRWLKKTRHWVWEHQGFFWRCQGCYSLCNQLVHSRPLKCYFCGQLCLCWHCWLKDMPMDWAKCSNCRVLEEISGDELSRVV